MVIQPSPGGFNHAYGPAHLIGNRRRKSLAIGAASQFLVVVLGAPLPFQANELLSAILRSLLRIQKICTALYRLTWLVSIRKPAFHLCFVSALNLRPKHLPSITTYPSLFYSSDNHFSGSQFSAFDFAVQFLAFLDDALLHRPRSFLPDDFTLHHLQLNCSP